MRSNAVYLPHGAYEIALLPDDEKILTLAGTVYRWHDRNGKGTITKVSHYIPHSQHIVERGRFILVSTFTGYPKSLRLKLQANNLVPITYYLPKGLPTQVDKGYTILEERSLPKDKRLLAQLYAFLFTPTMSFTINSGSIK